MQSSFFPNVAVTFVDHPKFAKVRIAKLVTSQDCREASVCILEIAPETEIPVHTHDVQIDSIYVAAGAGEAYINGAWQPISTGDYILVPAPVEHGIRTKSASLRLFVHHSPPLF